MKKLSVILLIFVVLLSGCTFNVSVLTPEPSSSQLTPYATQSNATPAATISATAVSELPTPTLVPPSTSPVFFNARTSSSSDDFHQQSSFPAGTKQVYAIWDYQNMQPGLMVKREWYWNNQVWLTREEPWDFDKYGAEGTIRDISIYDNETGLNSGVYQLRLYIESQQQPIGGSGINVPIKPWITFDIGLDEARQGYASPDYQWNVEVFGEKRIVLQDFFGNSTEIFTAREIPYLTWFADSQHFLFVDRDRSNQQPGTTIGIRDNLVLVDVPGGRMRTLYTSDTSFVGRGGPMPSPDGRYIASLEGSGFGDACFVDKHLIFFELALDLSGIKVITQAEFSGLPPSNDGTIYPAEDGAWEDSDSYRVTIDGTCNPDNSKFGWYSFNLADLSAMQASALIPGDLGTGMIHGFISDAITGAPILNASVTCEQHSYTSASPCSGTVLTNANGEYAFNNVFFHDTDTITLRIEAEGYEPQEAMRPSFTTNDWEAHFALNPKQ